ncbi:MAG: xylulokinase [Alsobacter sp.]
MATFLGIDVGTSSIKAILLDERQTLLAEAGAPLAVERPHPLWSEQDPEAWWQATCQAVAEIRARHPDRMAEVEGIGLSGQQHGATLLAADGSVLRPCILWNDGRSGAECRELLERVPDFMARSSNITMPGFTAPKLLWVARHEPDVFARVATVLLPKDYVRFRMTGARVSEMSDSAGTLWMDVAHRRWDDVLIEACGLTRAAMPDLVEGSEISATLSPEVSQLWGMGGRPVPVAGGGGDNACSAVGIGATREGDGFLSLGTSGVVFATTDRPVALPERTLHAFCHALPGRWHGMAVTLSGALSLSWLAGLLGASGDIPGLVAKAEDFARDPVRVAHAPMFLPYLTGERTPHNDPNATAHLAGLRVEHDQGALTYAVLEGVAFALADCLDVLVAAGAPPRQCMLVGGGSRSAFWAQVIADATGLTLDVPAGAEVGAAFGAARLGMLAAGGSEAEVCGKPSVRRRVEPGLLDAALVARRKAATLALYSGRA